MSDTETHIIALRLRERDLELEACAIRARTEEVRNMLELLENPRRPRGRPRKENWQSPRMGTEIIEMPARVDGGIAEPEPDSAA